ncbi:MAG: IS3 family transposase, partial [Myxococcota bacterium]|nr:IS3 family transposase [Myxococcota bacterium]
EDARSWVERFVAWYNEEHLHSGINFVSPGDRHSGRHEAILAYRERVYAEARQRRPGRWAGEARDWTPTAEVRLNPGRSGKEA